MGDNMVIDMGPLDPTPLPNAEFCIFREPGSEPEYLERYGVTLHNPDPDFKPQDVGFYIWSVFDLEDIGFKVFVNGSYNYKIDAGVDKGVLRFMTDEHSPGASACPRTKENLWFISYRLNQLPSEHLFYPQRPPGSSNIPPRASLSKGDLVDIQAAQEREQAAIKSKQSATGAPAAPQRQQPYFSTVNKAVQFTEVEKKLIVVQDALKKWGDVPFHNPQTFNDLLQTLVGPSAIKKLNMIAHGTAGVIQKRDAMLHFQDMATHPFWKRKPNNAVTKIVRAHFGLPVEPLTALNILNAGKGSNDPRMKIERHIPELQRELTKPGPLDFLDEYTEPQLGDPGMIRAAPKSKDLAYKFAFNQDITDLIYEHDAAKKKQSPPVNPCHTENDREPLPMDEDNSFAFLEKYRALRRDPNPEPLPSGALSPGADGNESQDGAAADGAENEDGAGNEDADDNDEDKDAAHPSAEEMMNTLEANCPAQDRSDPAIELLCDLNGRLHRYCLNNFRNSSGKVDIDAIRPHLVRLIGTGELYDAFNLLRLDPRYASEFKAPQNDRQEETKPTKKYKSPKERLIPRQAGEYDCWYLERNYELSLPIDWRSPEARFKLYGLVWNTHPDLVAKYRDDAGKLDYASMLKDEVKVPEDEDADELINAGGNPEMAVKEIEEWKQYQYYRLKEYARQDREEEGALRGGSLRGGAISSDDSFSSPPKPSSSPKGLDTSDAGGIPYEELKRVYEIDRDFKSRSNLAGVKRLGLAMKADPSILKPYRKPNGDLDYELLGKNQEQASRLLLSKDVRELTNGGTLPPAEKEGEEIFSFLQWYDKKQAEESAKDSESEKIHGYPKQFLEDVYEIHKRPEERSRSAISAHLELSNYMVEDQRMREEYGEGKSWEQTLDMIKDLYVPWIKNGDDMKEVVVYLEKGKKPSDTIYQGWLAKQSKKVPKSTPKPPASSPPTIRTPGKPQNQLQLTHQAGETEATGKVEAARSFTIGGVEFSPEQLNVVRPILRENRELKDKKAQAQRPVGNPLRGMRPLGPQPGQPHFVIPHEDAEEEEEVNEEEAEAEALARIELNGAENDTPEARINRLKRYKEAREQQQRRAAAKRQFIHDQSVHFGENGLPSIPEYGRTLEEAIDFHGAPPTLYMNTLTQKKMREIQHRNREMENLILGRQEYCGMCDKYILFESKLQKDNHYRGHRSIATSCGFCGVYFDYMQDFEKKQHLKKHANTKYGAEGQLQPYRNLEKVMKWPDDDLFIYCESCGMDLHLISTVAQMLDHADNCRRERDEKGEHEFDTADGDHFCVRCGKNLSYHSPPDRMKHVTECAPRHALGHHGRDNEIWDFATKNVPNREVATEEDISRTYCHLMTLVGIPGREDLPDEKHFGTLKCKFLNCDADLAQLASRDKLMEHLGSHIGNQYFRRYPCMIEGCDTDFADLRTILLKGANKEGRTYHETELAEEFVKHMREKHQARCCDNAQFCPSCLTREVRDGEFPGVDVGEQDETGRPEGDENQRQKEKEIQEAQQQKERDDAARSAADAAAAVEQKKRDDAAKSAADAATAAEQKKRDDAAKSAADAATAVEQKKRDDEARKAAEQKKNKEKDPKGKGKAKAPPPVATAKSDDEDAASDDSASSFDPTKDGPASSSDSDSEDSDDGSGAYRKGAIDKKDLDAQLDDRPGVYAELPKAWHAVLKQLEPKLAQAHVPTIAGSGKRPDPVPWVYACRGCGQKLKNYNVDIMNHRSVRPDGTAGCGLDDDLELVISTAKNMRWYRDEMEQRGLAMDPYLSPPPFLPQAPKKPFLWYVLRDVLHAGAGDSIHKQLRTITNVQTGILDASDELKKTKKVTELPLLEGKKVAFNRSPWQKAEAKKGKAKDGASTSADAAAAAAVEKVKKAAKKDKKRKSAAAGLTETGAAGSSSTVPRKKAKKGRSTI